LVSLSQAQKSASVAFIPEFIQSLASSGLKPCSCHSLTNSGARSSLIFFQLLSLESEISSLFLFKEEFLATTFLSIDLLYFSLNSLILFSSNSSII